MNRLLNYFPIILIFGIYAILFSVFYLLRKSRRKKEYRSPFNNIFLKSPGESLNRQIIKINDEIITYLFGVITTPLVLYSTYISILHFIISKPSSLVLTSALIIGIVSTAYCLWNLVTLLDKQRLNRFEYEGEVAAGQELYQLIRDGYRVYHDFPAGKFKIDHIIIGTSGVFAVETKAISKPTAKDRKADAKVKYDGKCLRFPNGTDVESLLQAKQHAEWLSKWLRSAVGEAVRVRPVVALPGWFVERVASGGIRVINPKNFRLIAKPKNGSILTDQMISRIVHQLEQRYRDVDPK